MYLKVAIGIFIVVAYMIVRNFTVNNKIEQKWG